MLKIGLNATCFNDRPSGARQRFVGIYSELINRLPDVNFVVYEPSDCRVGEWFQGASNVSAKQTNIPSEGRTRKFLGGLGYWPSALKHEEFDVFERFNLPIVKAPTGKTILTIHDIRNVHPGKSTLERKAYETYIGMSLRAADHVITVSEAMKKEILGFFPGVPISVIYNGLDTNEFDVVTEVDLQSFRCKYALPSEFLLSVGHFEGRKNYLRLIDTMALLRDKGRSCYLLIIGNDSGLKRAVEERVESLNLSACVRILNGLSDLEVRCAYKLCSLFVFPSSYEGFGIPILEAMAAGRPIVLSDIPVFREITQNRGIYFPFNDIGAMADIIDLGLSSCSERARLIEYGIDRVMDFSFKSLAIQMEHLYRSLIRT